MITAVSLFSGIGGIDLAFMQAGIDVIWANEVDKFACTTYRNNFTNKLIEADIRMVNSEDIPKADVLFGGFPCQSFSVMGYRRGFKDPRGNLFFEVVRIVKVIKPKVILLENVKNLIYHDNGRTFITIHNTLAELGYFIKYEVQNARTHGNIPQERSRTFIAAFSDHSMINKFEFPEEIPLTVKPNDIINRSVKHNDTYYYTDKSKYYGFLNERVIDKTGIYRIDDSGVATRKYKISPTLNFWFSTDTDPIVDGKGERNRYFYQYTLNKNTSGKEVLKQRTMRSGTTVKKEDPDYWETAEPVLSIGMKKGDRNEPVDKEVIYIDFRGEISAFDKYFYFGEPKKEKKQDFLRRKSKYVKRYFDGKDPHYPGKYGKDASKGRIELTSEEIKVINSILSKKYTKIIIITHRFYDGIGSSIIMSTQNSLKYSEANAGSGEVAVIQLVHKVMNAKPNSLILLDEPEVSLHPSAQKNVQTFLLEEIRKNHHQIVISTHSPAIIKGLPVTAIKLFTTNNAGQFHVDENIDYRAAFYELEEYAVDKINIICEDIDAKNLIIRALKNLNLDKYFVVNFAHGGADAIMKYIVPTYAMNINENNVFFIFDGDKYCDSYNADNFTGLESHNIVFLEGKVKSVYSGNLLKANVDGGKDGGDVEQKCEVYQQYIRYHYSNIGYLPNGKIPEEIVLSSPNVRSKYSSIITSDIEITSENAKELLRKISELRNDSNINQTFESLAYDLFEEDKSDDLDALLKLLKNIYDTRKICHDTRKELVTV